MLSLPERLIAFRYLRPRRGDRFVSLIGLFSLLGIMLCVATLIVVMSVMNGFRAELFRQILGLNGHIAVYGAAGDLHGYDALARRVEALPGVISALPQIEGQAMLTGGGQAAGVIVRGITPKDFARRPVLKNALKGGNVQALAEPGTVVLGSRLAERLRLTLGDELTLVAPEPSRTAFGLVPRYKTYRVADVFEVGMYEYDNNFLYMPLDSARLFFGVREGAVHTLDVLIEDTASVDGAALAIQALAPGRLILRDWRQTNHSFFQALEVERNVMFLILTLIIVVAAFNIISSLIMLVKDKTRDIAVLRTLGATQGSILRIFMLAGSSLGVLGGGSGRGSGRAGGRQH